LTITAGVSAWGQVVARPRVNDENFPPLGSTSKEQNKQKWQAYAAGGDDMESATSIAAELDHESRSTLITPSGEDSEAGGSPQEFDLIDWDDEDRPTIASGVGDTTTSLLSHWKRAAKHRSAAIARLYEDSGEDTTPESSPSKIDSQELLEAFDVADDEIVGYPVLGLAIAQAEGESDTVEETSREDNEDDSEEL